MTVIRPTRVSVQGPPSARAVAFAVLVESVTSDEGLDVVLERAIVRVGGDARERALTVELTYGVLRQRAMLDWRLAPVLDKPLARLPVAVQMLLRLGAYQLVCLDRIPASAAVNESVKLARGCASRLGRDWSGLVNAVLRGLTRLSLAPWPSVATQPAEALAVRYSVPEWLSRRWVERLGVEAAEAACAGMSVVPPLTLRVNLLRTTRATLLDLFAQAGLTASPTSVSPLGILLESGGGIPSLPGFAEGAFYVEDEAAQLIPRLLDPQPGDCVLDACAAPGGKTTQIAQLMQNQGIVYAVDRNASRLDVLRTNCQRLGVNIVVPIVGDSRAPIDWGAAWQPAGAPVVDRILVDAPCSGLGVLRRHPEAKWRKEANAFARHHALQYEILEAVAPCLRPGGVLVYSTCATEPEENEDVVARFCRTHRDFQRESVGPWLPPSAHAFVTAQGTLSTLGNRVAMDGFYAARLRKNDG